jgi:hypothetical protein
MKLKTTLAFILLLFAFACKKNAESDAVTGKWRTTEIFFTSANSDGPLYIQFIWPGKVQSTYFSKCTGYSIKGNNLTLENTGAPNLTYSYTIKSDTLTLYNAAGCSTGNCNAAFVKE